MARFIGALVLIALSVGGTLATWPQLAELELTAPWAQIVSMRGLGAAIAVFFAMIFVLLRAGFPSRRGYLGALSFILFAFALANTVILGVRGVFPAELPRPKAEQIRVMAWNTLGDEVAVETIAEVADETFAQIIVLPETTSEHAQLLAAQLKNDIGKDFAVHTLAFDQVYKARSTSALISKKLGEYQLTNAFGSTGPLPSLVLEPVNRGSGPRIVAAHSVSPQNFVGDLGQWREDYEWLAGMCDLPNTLIIGDTNATPDQLRNLHGCTLASLTSRAGGLGTWPTTLPAILGAQVDQVMTTGNWTSAGFRVISDYDSVGSDHRPVAAVLVPSEK